MSWGIDKIQQVDRPILRLVFQRNALGLDGDTSLTLKIHGVEYLSSHFTLGQATTNLDKTIGDGGFTVIDMGDDGEISNMRQFGH